MGVIRCRRRAARATDNSTCLCGVSGGMRTTTLTAEHRRHLDEAPDARGVVHGEPPAHAAAHAVARERHLQHGWRVSRCGESPSELLCAPLTASLCGSDMPHCAPEGIGRRERADRRRAYAGSGAEKMPALGGLCRTCARPAQHLEGGYSGYTPACVFKEVKRG